MRVSRRALIILLLAVALVSAVILSTGCKKAQTPKTTLGSETAGGAAVESSVTSGAPSGEQPKATDGDATQPANNNGTGTNGTGSSGGSGSGSSGNGSNGSSDGGSNTESNGNTNPPSTKGMTVKIIWWNNTDKVAPNAMEVVYGTQTFKPDVRADKSEGSIGPVPYGKDAKLIVYPKGKGGPAVTVAFKVTDVMQSGSERDAIHVAVTDTSVRVLGNPIVNFEKDFDR